ncbi:alternative RNA polymerase sigma factor sigM [Mycobacterium tuberculosis GM 1503]|nr:alternative RNA polymerase sigma factor sigM [Mycobacterium tuberculosis GM 1503]
MPPPIGYCPAVGFGGRHERSDAELLAAHVAGDRYAFDQLFRRHHRQLHRLARLTSRTSEDADDALQDAMLSAHRGAGSFRYDAAVSSWLHRIVVNACLDRLRRAKAHPTAPLEDVYPVADRTAQVETAIAVQRALMRLPVEQPGRGGRRGHAGLFDRRHRPDAGRGRGHRQEPLRPGAGPPSAAAGLSQHRGEHPALTPLPVRRSIDPRARRYPTSGYCHRA